MKSSPFLQTLLFFSCCAAVLVVTDWHFFFATPFHEVGDVAVNALQVTDAKHGAEILGNYSRFHFHHPGPGFFYLYAAAEWLLCDRLQTGLTPHNAHSLAVGLVQIAFFATGLLLLARRIQLKFFLSLALLVATLHFSLADQKLVSLWPPHVLLMPFFCFAVSCITLASGSAGVLPLVILSGSLLVHGHVAQPLFVVLMSVAAYLLAWHQSRAGNAPAPWRAHLWSHLFAGFCLLLFLTPLVIDALKGQNSNLAEILRHMRDQSSHKSPAKSGLYLLSFLSYRHDQEAWLNSLSWTSLRFLREGIGYYLAWALLVFAIVRQIIQRRLTLPPPALAYLRTCAWALAGMFVLFFGWGIMQTGPMFEFNGYFFYSISFLGLLLGCAIAAAYLERWHTGWHTPVLYVAAAVIFHQNLQWGYVNDADAGRALLGDIKRAIKTDPLPAAPKILVFDHDDWPLVASVALALHRERKIFYVDRAWDFMFKDQRVLPLSLLADPHADMSVWRIGRKTGAAGEVALGTNAAVCFSPNSLSPTKGEIDFSVRGNLARYQLHGLSTPDRDFTWAVQPDVVLQFTAERAEDDVELEIVAEPFLPPGQPAIQPTELRFNGVLLFSAPFAEPGVLRARILRDIWNSQPIAHLHLHMPYARSPSDLRLSSDIRILSLAIKKLTTRRADPLPR